MPSLICEKGHRFERAGSFTVCPICDKENAPKDSFLSVLPAPARRAFEAHNVLTLSDYLKVPLTEVKDWHGVGPKALKLIDEMVKKTSS